VVIKCGRDSSCSSIDVVSIDTSAIALHCDGYKSCRSSSVKITKTDTANIFGGGYDSLSKSNMILSAKNTTLQCLNYSSCQSCDVQSNASTVFTMIMNDASERQMAVAPLSRIICPDTFLNDEGECILQCDTPNAAQSIDIWVRDAEDVILHAAHDSCFKYSTIRGYKGQKYCKIGVKYGNGENQWGCDNGMGSTSFASSTLRLCEQAWITSSHFNTLLHWRVFLLHPSLLICVRVWGSTMPRNSLQKKPVGWTCQNISNTCPVWDPWARIPVRSA